MLARRKCFIKKLWRTAKLGRIYNGALVSLPNVPTCYTDQAVELIYCSNLGFLTKGV